ncbi:MAG: hypothetical protein IT449_08785 [Phycisphaerales bacterium]|nr:hypothetical protein [Phycisphaerales bacterium]
MKFEYDPRLIELAVFHRVRVEPQLEPAVHAVLDPLYLLPAGTARDARFHQAYAEMFQQLGLNRFVEDLLAEQPIVAGKADRCLVRQAARARQESIELYQRDDDPSATRTVLVQLTPEHLADPDPCRDEMRRELQHVADMMDPAFQYRAADLAGQSPQDNLVRDRYHVMWNVYVESRLTSAGHIAGGRKTALRNGFLRSFGGRFNPPVAAFEALWAPAKLDHSALMAMAQDPRRLPGWEESNAGGGDLRETLGSPCTLCGFSTFDWFDLQSEAGRRLVRILVERRDGWDTASGVCRQCAEACLARHASGSALCGV